MTSTIGRRLATLSRPVALTLVAGAYGLAFVAGLASLPLSSQWHPLARTLLADVVATVVVFAVSTAVENASLYDPYWSVAPPVILIAWLGVAGDGVPARQLAVLVLTLAWAVRLTANWATGWRGLGHEDWRYLMLRDQSRGRLPFWVVNLGGIQLMPTLVVFAGLVPAWVAFQGGRAFNVIDVAAIAVTAGAIVLESTADLQLRRFTADPAHRGQVAEVGVWRYSRHPNYLGEIGFWCGLYLFALAAAPRQWWALAGPLVMIALFTTVSVPMMDRRSRERRPGYADYAARVPALLPRFPRPRPR